MELTGATIKVNMPDDLGDERTDKLGEEFGDDIEAWLDFKMSALKQDFKEEFGHRGAPLSMETEVG